MMINEKKRIIKTNDDNERGLMKVENERWMMKNERREMMRDENGEKINKKATNSY